MRRITIALALAALTACSAPAAAQQPPLPEAGGAVPVGPDTKRLRFSYGPIHVAPGQNLILAGPVTVEKPAYDGFVTRFKPDLVYADGTPPPVDVIHLHHGVWLNLSRRDVTAPGTPGDRMAASGEEKTIFTYPEGYGYPLRARDVMAINYMLHNQTPVSETVWITWEIDFVAASSPTGRALKPVYPVWMDVDNGSAYPVFDVHRGSGGDGRFTYPDEADSPYGSRPPKNVWTVPAGGGALLFNVGHVHPGGLWTDLEIERGTQRQLLFRSEAEYFNDRPPVSWDMAMTATPPGWRVGLRAGDRLRVSATYETELASWYESMGIAFGLWAPGEDGPDPFASPPPTSGAVTHGPLPENSNFGGGATGQADPATLPDGQTLDGNVGIFGFLYTPGDFGAPGGFRNPPVVDKGDELKFHNGDAGAQVFHTVTACRPPCNRSTGIGYPLADGEPDFDSGELGYGPPGVTAAANRHNWTLDTDDLDPGTYTYFCRVHPYMRGAFRVR